MMIVFLGFSFDSRLSLISICFQIVSERIACLVVETLSTTTPDLSLFIFTCKYFFIYIYLYIYIYICIIYTHLFGCLSSLCSTSKCFVERRVVERFVRKNFVNGGKPVLRQNVQSFQINNWIKLSLLRKTIRSMRIHRRDLPWAFACTGFRSCCFLVFLIFSTKTYLNYRLIQFHAFLVVVKIEEVAVDRRTISD